MHKMQWKAKVIRMFNKKKIAKLEADIFHRDSLIAEFLSQQDIKSSWPVHDFQEYLLKFKKTKQEQAERAKIEAIIMDLVKKSALKD